MGVAAGDYDNDGYPDLYVTGFGRARLLRNRGDGSFEDSTDAARAGEVGWSVSAAFVDFDRDGWLDLFVGNYVDATAANHKVCRAPAGYRDYCGPLSYNAVPSRLLHNRGDGTFDDVSVASGITARYGPALGVATADFDGDGWLDLYVANDQAANQLWRNRGDGTFADDALLAGCAFNGAGRAEALDGRRRRRLRRRRRRRSVHRPTSPKRPTRSTSTTVAACSATPPRPPGSARRACRSPASGPPGSTGTTTVGSICWSPTARWSSSRRSRRAAIRFRSTSPICSFATSATAGSKTSPRAPARRSPSPTPAAASAFGDLDNDGDVDVVIANTNGPARLLRNDAADGTAWLGLRLIGAPGGAGERDLLGARAVLLRDRPPLLARRSRADGSYASANDPRVLFGLGRPADDAPERVRVTWPDGKVEEWDDLAAGRYHTLRQGEGRTVAAAGAAS